MGEMSEVFYTFLITSLIGLILAVGKICYKSKCSQIDLCCIKITRNIDAEVREDLEMGDSTKNNEETKR
jgi:hypothetical protein